jgi:hypothetical protein
MGLTSRYQWHQRKKARKIFMSLSVQALLTPRRGQQSVTSTNSGVPNDELVARFSAS